MVPQGYMEATMPGTCFFAQRRVRSLNKVLCEKAELAVQDTSLG